MAEQEVVIDNGKIVEIRCRIDTETYYDVVYEDRR